MAHRKLGTPVTIGELREMIKDFPDDTHFGFRNQPIQKLEVNEYDGVVYVSFQEIEEEPWEEEYVSGVGFDAPFYGGIIDDLPF
jgi:hypothetical protein